ncbi:hypothetical protein CMO94_01435 [Candidatus Woesearchaeota archaeon]|jgi:hypothetical protein|nr:hypothetical protein [Candidatus Woesearchaeota archaeon]
MGVLKHKVFLLIFLLSLVLKVFSLFVAHDIWWDSSVYLGMGKYIYSFGDVGLWESSRPLIWPLILGFLWKIGFDAIFFGKLAVIAFSSGILLLTYIIAHELFNKKIAVLSAFFLALSSTFFLFGNVLHSEIPSTFFVMLGFYYFIKQKYNISGLFLGIAFMTRFFQIFAFIPLVLLLFYLVVKKKKAYKTLFYFSMFFLIPVVPYLILNYILYNNIFYPFLLQSWMSKYTGLIFSQPFYFYFVNLVKENVLSLFSILGLLFIFKKYDFKKLTIAIVFLFVFIPYNLVAHKEMRLLITALPFLYILTGYGIFYFVGLFKRNKNLLLSLLLITFLIVNVPKLKFDEYADNLDVFYDYVGDERVGNGLWISNPAFIVYSNVKADLIYYPLYNSKKIDTLTDDIDNAERILINTCDLLSCPVSDNTCNQKHNNFINLLKNRFNMLYYNKFNQCEYYIFN